MSTEPENKMLFDLRGRRKRVIQVIYVILAFLMASSLIFVGTNGMLGDGCAANPTNDSAKLFLEQADKAQTKVDSNPGNLNAHVELIRARNQAGNSLMEVDASGAQASTPEAQAQYEKAAEAWSAYVKKAGDKVDPSVAQLMAGTLFNLAQGSTVAQFKKNMNDAAEAQRIYTEHAVKEQENGGANAGASLTTLAMYQYYAQDFAAAAKTREQALAAANNKAERTRIDGQLNRIEKEAHQVGLQIKKAEKQAKKDGGKSLENPFGSLGTGSATAP